jgi:hypothetical protein
LNSSAESYFDNQLSNKKGRILYTSTVEKTFSSEILGDISFTVEKTNFNSDAFQSVANDAIEEQWKYNYLSNGSMPYSYCYGSRNSCYGYGCSQIKVRSGNSDILVTIKNSYGTVVRHGYIRSGRSMTFEVSDGSYSVYFYSGKGWNPKKFMTYTDCGKLVGGFVTNESFTKDNYVSLYNQIMTYELISQRGGNFNAKSSSKSEAF